MIDPEEGTHNTDTMEAGDSDKQGSQGDCAKNSKEDVIIKSDDSERKTESTDPESDSDGNSEDENSYTDSQEPDDESEGSEEETGTEEDDVDTDDKSDVDGEDVGEDRLRKDEVPVCLTATQAELVWSNTVDNADMTECQDASSAIFEAEAVLDVEQDEEDETSQKKEPSEQSEDISEGGVEAGLSSSLNGLSIVSTSSKPLPSVPPCTLPPACLYNQSGKLCRALGERCILTVINSAPVFVGTRIEQCEWGPVGVGVVWCSGRPLTLDQVPDGAEVCFDAVILPGTSKFIALVVWQGIKPITSIEPYFNSYVIVEEFNEIKVTFVSCEDDHGVVRATIDDKEQLVEFSNSVVFKNGQKVESRKEIDDLCGFGCGELFANVCKFVTVDGGDKTSYQYGFMCSCLWSEMKPQNTGITSSFDKFTLYQKVGSYYTDGKEQLYMHCDAQSELVLSDGGCKLTYKNNQATIDIPCLQESFYCYNQCVSPVRGGQVKAHLRRTKDTDGKERWSAVMVQLPHSLVNTTTTAPPRAKDRNTSKVFKNVKGILHWNKDQKMFVISTKYRSLPSLLVVGVRAKVVQDNVLKDFTDQTAFTSVHFDVYFEKLKSVIVAIWKSHKPHAFYNKSKSTKYYYDVPGSYRGKAKNQLQFDVVLDGEIKSIPVVQRKVVFTSEGQPCNSIPISSQVTLHLKETTRDDGKSLWSTMLVVVNTGQNDATNSESNAKASVAGDSSDTCSKLMKCNNKHMTKKSNDNQKPTSNKTSKIFKNCQGTLYWAKALEEFRIATQTKGLPSEVSVGIRSYCVQDGKFTDVNKDSEARKVKFDCYFDGNDKFHILPMWKGTKPAEVYNKNGSNKYYYDVAGVYHGMRTNLMMFDVILNGQIRSITTNVTKVVFNEGQHCTSIPVSSQVVLHLKEFCNDKERPWLAMVVVVERGTTKAPSLLSHKLQRPKTNEGAKHDTANSNVSQKTLAAGQMKKHKQASSHIGSKNSSERNYATQNFNETVSRKSSTRTSIWQSDSVRSGGNMQMQTSEVLKNCHGTLYWHNKMEHFVIATKLNGIPFEVNIGKHAYYVSNGRLIDVNDKVSKLPVQFDSHFSNTKLNILAIWQGNKPQSSCNMSKSRRYYYDIPGVYQGQSKNNLLMFDIMVDGQIRSITTEHTKAVYTAEGQRCKSCPISSQVSLHLMEPCKVMSPWLATLVIVEEQDLSSDSSLLPLVKDSSLRTQGGVASAAHVKDSYPRTQGGMASAHFKNSYPCTQSGMTSMHVKKSYSRTQGGMMSTQGQDAIPRTQGDMSSAHVRNSYSRIQGSMASTHVQDSCPRTQGSMASALVRDSYSRAHRGMASAHVRDSYPSGQSGMDTYLENCFSRTHDNMTSAFDKNSYSIAQDSFAYADRVPSSNKPDDNSMWLCPETLKQYLSSGSLEELILKHCMSHPVYRGQIEDMPGGTSLFHCSLLPSPMIVSDIPQFRWRKSGISGNTYCLLASKNFENGNQNYYPLFMWPEGASCDPYIITANGPALHDKKNKLLGLEIGGEVVFYSYGYDVAFTRKDNKNINEFFHSLKTPIFAIVENIPPMYVDGDLVEGEILLLSSSLIVALAGISTLIGNYSTVQIEREMPGSGFHEVGWSNQSVPVSSTKKLIGSGLFKSGRSDIGVSLPGTSHHSYPSYGTENRTYEGMSMGGGSGTKKLIGGGCSLMPGRPNQSIPSYGPNQTAGGGFKRPNPSHGVKVGRPGLLVNSLATKNVIGDGQVRSNRLTQNVQGKPGQSMQGRVNQAFQDRPNQAIQGRSNQVFQGRPNQAFQGRPNNSLQAHNMSGDGGIAAFNQGQPHHTHSHPKQLAQSNPKHMIGSRQSAKTNPSNVFSNRIVFQ